MGDDGDGVHSMHTIDLLCILSTQYYTCVVCILWRLVLVGGLYEPRMHRVKLCIRARIIDSRE
jgi:hypothetical protein